jgi:hypothetical protein
MSAAAEVVRGASDGAIDSEIDELLAGGALLLAGGALSSIVGGALLVAGGTLLLAGGALLLAGGALVSIVETAMSAAAEVDEAGAREGGAGVTTCSSVSFASLTMIDGSGVVDVVAIAIEVDLLATVLVLFSALAPGFPAEAAAHCSGVRPLRVIEYSCCTPF